MEIQKPQKKRKMPKGLPKRTRSAAGNRTRNDRKYAGYRRRVGKPRGPGQPGNKRGKNA